MNKPGNVIMIANVVSLSLGPESLAWIYISLKDYDEKGHEQKKTTSQSSPDPTSAFNVKMTILRLSVQLSDGRDYMLSLLIDINKNQNY